MSHLFGVGLNVEVNRINTQFKMQIAKKGGIGLRTLAVLFRRADHNGNKKLDREEFTECLASYGLFPKVVEIQALFKFYDIDGDGNITYEEFVRGLREPLTERRQAIVNKAFTLMDKDESGVITLADIDAIYDVSQNQDFIEGRLTREQILEHFLAGFEGVKGNKDGKISREEWCDYYTDLSMSVPSDLYFVQMMESVWGIVENEDSQVSKEQLEHLTKTLRHKLLDFSNGRTEELVLRNIFREFDLNNNGVLTVDELGALMARMQISVDRRFLQGLLKKFDRNGNGAIEFDEFVDFVVNDPYH